jgi:lantibiotic modifying enzyme
LAALLSERLLDDRIRTEREPEILYGVAGLLLAVRKLHQVLPSEHTKRQAALCVKNLVSSFRRDAGWIRPNGDCSLGFAHGAAGIAYALAVGGAILDDISGLDTARKAIEFDRQFFDQGAHNWPATTDSGDVRMRAWCSGLPGVILSRAGVWARSRDPQLLAEVEANIPHLPNLLGLDHWCCGSAGAAEVLMCIANLLDRDDLMANARSVIDQTVRRALKTVYYRFGPEVGENYCFQPSLFRGLAGIGYTLIRSMSPLDLPCILTFE